MRCTIAPLILLVACADPPLGYDTSARGQDTCENICPRGTRESAVGTREAIEQGGFVFVKDRCQRTCVPEQACILPFIPTVTQDVFTCAPLEGFASFPAKDMVTVEGVSPWPPMCPARWSQTSIAELVETRRPENKALVAADVDGDGDEDLVLAYNAEEVVTGGSTVDHPFVQLFRNDGGTFVEQPARAHPKAIVGLIRLRRGAGPDAALALSVDQEAMAIMGVLLTGAGLDAPIDLGIVSRCDGAPRVGDVDGDGYDDLLFFRDETCQDASAIQIRRGSPMGLTPTVFRAGGALSFFAVGDMNGDGRDELVVTGGNGASFVVDDLGGPNEALRPLNLMQRFIVEGLDDLDGDGCADAWQLQGVERPLVQRSDCAMGFGAVVTGARAPRSDDAMECTYLGRAKVRSARVELLYQCVIDATRTISRVALEAGALGVHDEHSPGVRGPISAVDLDDDGVEELITLDGSSARILHLRSPR